MVEATVGRFVGVDVNARPSPVVGDNVVGGAVGVDDGAVVERLVGVIVKVASVVVGESVVGACVGENVA